MAVVDLSVAQAFGLADLTGVFANAVLGGLLARAARFDLVGFIVLATVSGLGGGIIRDVLLQNGPPVALTDYAYVTTALAGALVAFVLPVEGRTWNRVFPLVDAVALGAWAAAGAQKALALDLGWLPALLLGTLTAVGGSVVRDVLLRRVPAIFDGGPLYATSALAASGVMVALDGAGQPTLGLLLTTLVGAGLTLLARWRRWRLPGPLMWESRDARRRLPRPRWSVRGTERD